MYMKIFLENEPKPIHAFIDSVEGETTLHSIEKYLQSNYLKKQIKEVTVYGNNGTPIVTYILNKHKLDIADVVTLLEKGKNES